MILISLHRRRSAISLTIPSNLQQQQQRKLYPNRRPERGSSVRKAAYNFRRQSLLKKQIERQDETDGGNKRLDRSISVDVPCQVS